jgi:hypothetical protein
MSLDGPMTVHDLFEGAILGFALELFWFLAAIAFLAHVRPPLFKLPRRHFLSWQKERNSNLLFFHF